MWAGIQPDELYWFADNPCPPQVIGVNHYLSGQRYLDERIEQYPEEARGGNGRDKYVDVLAARVLKEGPLSVDRLLMEVWERYGLPIAITECHNACTREEQLRWFAETWQSAELARYDGANVIAVTAWALLGAYGWNKLVTEDSMSYEVGVLDARTTPPRETSLAYLLRCLASSRKPRHPLLETPGWWRRSQRHVYGFTVDESGALTQIFDTLCQNDGCLAICTSDGRLPKRFTEICRHRGIHTVQVHHMDLSDVTAIYQPWGIIQTSECTDSEPSAHMRILSAKHKTLGCIVQLNLQYDPNGVRFPALVSLETSQAEQTDRRCIAFHSSDYNSYLNELVDLLIDFHFEALMRAEIMLPAVLCPAA